MTAIRVTIPCFHRGPDPLDGGRLQNAFDECMRKARRAAREWERRGCVAEIRARDLRDPTDAFWYKFDIAKIEILRAAVRDRARGDVCVVADADVTPTDQTVADLAALKDDRLALAKGRDPWLENSLVACRATPTMADAIARTLDAMRACVCECATPHKHSFKATVALLPVCIYAAKYGYPGPIRAPTCPDNGHYAAYLADVRLDIVAENLPADGTGAKPPRSVVAPVRADVPRSSH